MEQITHTMVAPENQFLTILQLLVDHKETFTCQYRKSSGAWHVGLSFSGVRLINDTYEAVDVGIFGDVYSVNQKKKE